MENRFAVRLKFGFSSFSASLFGNIFVLQYFQFLSNHNGFFLARHDQYFIMFKDSNVFEFTNFLFKTKHNNTVVYSVNNNYLLSRGKQEKKLLKQFFD